MTAYNDFINENELSRHLGQPSNPEEIRRVCEKSAAKEALTVAETAVLLNAPIEERPRIFETARDLKRRVYGNRIVLFAPLYIGNYCVNECRYCAFKRSNREVNRRTLSPEDIHAQVRALEDKGHKRLILVFGDHPDYNGRFIADSVRAVYETTSGYGEIRRVNINAAPMEVPEYRLVKEAGIGTYQIFQETYHHETYRQVHGEDTPKGNYLYRLHGLSRAFEAGIDDVGIGALFGLYDWRFEVLALVAHARFLTDTFGVGPHTVSFPRLQPAHGVTDDWPYLVGDEDFKYLVAVLRLAIPYTGLILTAREKAELRRELMGFGVSQIDAGSRIELGGYSEMGDAQVQASDREQFALGDLRSLDDVMFELVSDGYLPSFCTACYRVGRTGEHFMEFAIPGFIKRYCTPNALLTLAEYVEDYGSERTKRAAADLIAKETAGLADDKVKRELQDRLTALRNNEGRDYYF